MKEIFNSAMIKLLKIKGICKKVNKKVRLLNKTKNSCKILN